MTDAFLRAAGADPGDWSGLRTDPGAPLMAHHRFDAAALCPQVAAPDSPANAMDAGAVPDTATDVAHIGA